MLPAVTSNKMDGVLLACLALSHSNQDDSASAKQASCIASALMFSPAGDDGSPEEVIDPLNPFHTLQVKHMSKVEQSTQSKSVLAYAASTPYLLDTSSS